MNVGYKSYLELAGDQERMAEGADEGCTIVQISLIKYNPLYAGEEETR